MYQIQKTSIFLKEKLGNGLFGTVYKAIWKRRRYKQNVAIKIVHQNIMSYQQVLVEADLLSNCNHKHIVKCFGIVKDLLYPSTGIVMEFMSSGDLQSYLIAEEERLRHKWNKWYLQKICYQIALAMEFLEDLGVIHRDLAARNVLVEEITGQGPSVKVGDFGHARSADYYLNYSSPIPFRWSAPEVLDYREYSNKSDVWAYGVTIWEVYTFACMPYGNMENFEVEECIKYGNSLQCTTNMPWTVRTIFKCCFNYDPYYRWSFKDIVYKFETYFDRRSVEIQHFYYH